MNAEQRIYVALAERQYQQKGRTTMASRKPPIQAVPHGAAANGMDVQARLDAIAAELRSMERRTRGDLFPDPDLAAAVNLLLKARELGAFGDPVHERMFVDVRSMRRAARDADLVPDKEILWTAALYLTLSGGGDAETIRESGRRDPNLLFATLAAAVEREARSMGALDRKNWISFAKAAETVRVNIATIGRWVAKGLRTHLDGEARTVYLPEVCEWAANSRRLRRPAARRESDEKVKALFRRPDTGKGPRNPGPRPRR